MSFISKAPQMSIVKVNKQNQNIQVEMGKRLPFDKALFNAASDNPNRITYCPASVIIRITYLYSTWTEPETFPVVQG